jgi:hypothetical protein
MVSGLAAWSKEDFPHFARNYVDHGIVMWSLPLTTNLHWGERKDQVQRLINAKLWF